MVDAFLNYMYRVNVDFVLTVTRDFLRNCQTPILVLADDVPAHSMPSRWRLCISPNAQVSFPLKASPGQIPLALRHIRTFLQGHRTVTCAHQLSQPKARGRRSARNAVRSYSVHLVMGALRRSFACFASQAMRTRFKVLALVAGVLAAGTSSVAMARYPCAQGYTYRHHVCQPIHSPGYSNPASGAVSGEAAGAAKGAATGGPVGAVVGGALGTASGALTGTANMLTPPPGR